MEESLEQAIEVLKQKVEEKAKELNEAKKAVNQFCVCIGETPIYEINGGSVGALTTDLKGHEYYMKPTATVVADILERRGETGGPATVKEIFEQMKAGGYLFEAKSDENAMRGLRQSITKNSTKFHKLPNGKIGLTKWFPELKTKDAEQEPKKKRGRPRKKSKEQETINEESQNQTETKENEKNPNAHKEGKH